jgi:hypothetical protein
MFKGAHTMKVRYRSTDQNTIPYRGYLIRTDYPRKHVVAVCNRTQLINYAGSIDKARVLIDALVATK